MMTSVDVRASASRLADACRTLGFPRALWVVPGWTVHRRFVVSVCVLRAALPEPPQGLDLRWTELAATDADIVRLRSIDPASCEAEIARRRREGQACTLGWLGDQLVYVRWDSRGRHTFLPFLGRTLCLLDGDVYSAHACTSRVLGGHGIHSTFHLRALHRARELGFVRSISIAAWWNTPALRAGEKAGRTCAGTVGFTRTPRGRRYFAAGAVRLDGTASFHVER